MNDEGFKWSEELLNDLEKRIDAEYAQASKEMTEKVQEYFSKFKVKDEKKRKDYESGKITKAEYTEWRRNQMLIGNRYIALRDTLVHDLTNVDQIAMKYASDAMIDVYALNMNYETYCIEHDLRLDTSFTLYNHDAVERLIKENPDLLPRPKVDIPKDMRWNRAHIQSAITQGILQGESIPKIAKRLQNVTGMDKRAAIRNARTAITSAQNGGRLDSMKRAQQRGIGIKKGWMATLDARTRDSHAVMDGEVVELDKPFSNGLMRPADPHGEPSQVYNCRCRLTHEYDKYKTDWSNPANRNISKLGNMTYQEWKDKHKAKKTNKMETISKGVNGKNIIDTWKRRTDEFDFAIEDIINAQGFDGLPQVVSKEEFDKYVEESNFIAQRTYSAPSQEILEAYHEQLYNGKWYVDCSTGGSKYGKGMYCAANYEGKLTNQIKQEMIDYQGQNVSYTGASSVHYIETFTLSKNANVIEYDKIVELKAAEYNRRQELVSNVEWRGKTDEEYAADLKKARNYAAQIANMDEGTYASLLGYDAIRTTAGTSGADTIILNRTKVIFKGE
jgi:SPP1 gp7 family putative phage head morphogenesis protein